MAEAQFPFGEKLSEVKAKGGMTPPTPPTPPEPELNSPVIEPAKGGTPPTPPVSPATPPTPPEPPKSVEWLTEANKFFKSEFKTPEEFGQVFEKAKKVDEYEPKIKGFEDSEKKYQQQLADMKSSLNPLTYFSSQESYVAEQLIKQRPDLNPRILQDVIRTDNKVMDDIDVLVKDAFLKTPRLKGGEQGVKETILSDFGIENGTPQDEWPISAQNKLMMRAEQARKEWDQLKGQVKLPEIMTPEQKAENLAKVKEEKTKTLTPLKQTFSKFDKFTEEIEPGKIFEFNVPDAYKETLPEMFEQYFVEAGMEPNQESLQSMEKLKRALLLEENFTQIYKTIEGDVETRMRAEYDKLLGNTKPPNTQTATGQEDDKVKYDTEHGFGKLLKK